MKSLESEKNLESFKRKVLAIGLKSKSLKKENKVITNQTIRSRVGKMKKVKRVLSRILILG